MSDPIVDGDLTLRRADPGDAADVAEVYNEADVRHWMLWEPEHVDEVEALANIARSEESWADGDRVSGTGVDFSTDWDASVARPACERGCLGSGSVRYASQVSPGWGSGRDASVAARACSPRSRRIDAARPSTVRS